MVFKRKKKEEFDTVQFESSDEDEDDDHVEEDQEEDEEEDLEAREYYMKSVKKQENEKEKFGRGRPRLEKKQYPELPSLPIKNKTLHREVEREMPEAEIEPEKIMVVKDFPMQQVRKVKLEDGSFARLITVEEALEELLSRAR